MCGIFAVSRAEHSSIIDSRRFIIAGLLAIESRGYDSTGVAYTRGKGRHVWYSKAVGPATKVAGDLDLGSGPIRSAIGHTRWSSQGAHTYDNAHPVVAANIVLAHNGVIDDVALLPLTAVERVGEVDSWALAAIIQNHVDIGSEHPADVLALVEGDAAVAWFDADEPEVLHLARLRGRPMTIGFTRRGDLVMSSTRQTMRLTSTLGDVGIEDVIDVPEWTYLRVYQGKIVEWRAIGEVPSPTPPGEPLLIHDVPRGKRGNPRKTRRARPRSIHHGITDRIQNRPDDWWEEAEALLGDDWADDNWPSGIEQIRARPRNRHDW
jgi:glucosamine 6-phosphate synthetase-like amidotransferase/phosphosugar isomerase protein